MLNLSALLSGIDEKSPAENILLENDKCDRIH